MENSNSQEKSYDIGNNGDGERVHHGHGHQSVTLDPFRRDDDGRVFGPKSISWSAD